MAGSSLKLNGELVLVKDAVALWFSLAGIPPLFVRTRLVRSPQTVAFLESTGHKLILGCQYGQHFGLAGPAGQRCAVTYFARPEDLLDHDTRAALPRHAIPFLALLASVESLTSVSVGPLFSAGAFVGAAVDRWHERGCRKSLPWSARGLRVVPWSEVERQVWGLVGDTPGGAARAAGRLGETMYAVAGAGGARSERRNNNRHVK